MKNKNGTRKRNNTGKNRFGEQVPKTGWPFCVNAGIGPANLSSLASLLSVCKRWKFGIRLAKQPAGMRKSSLKSKPSPETKAHQSSTLEKRDTHELMHHPLKIKIKMMRHPWPIDHVIHENTPKKAIHKNPLKKAIHENPLKKVIHKKKKTR